MALGTAAHAAEVMQAIAEVGNRSVRAAEIKDEQALKIALTLYAEQSESQRRAYEMQLATALQEYSNIQAQKREALKSLAKIGLMDKAKGNLDTVSADFQAILNKEVDNKELKLSTLAQQESFYQGKIHAASQLVSREAANLNKALNLLSAYSRGQRSPLLGEAIKISTADRDFIADKKEVEAIVNMAKKAGYSDAEIQGLTSQLSEALAKAQEANIKQQQIDLMKQQLSIEALKYGPEAKPDIGRLTEIANTALASRLSLIPKEDIEARRQAYSEWETWADRLYKQYGYKGLPTGMFDTSRLPVTEKEPSIWAKIFGGETTTEAAINMYQDVYDYFKSGGLFKYLFDSNAATPTKEPMVGPTIPRDILRERSRPRKKTKSTTTKTTKTKKSTPSTKQRLIQVGLNYHTNGLKGLF